MIATLGSIAESVSLHKDKHGEPVCQNAIYLERSFHAGQFMQSVFRLYRIGSDPDLPVKNIHVLSRFFCGLIRSFFKNLVLFKSYKSSN